jgi:hypothetical protein
MTTTLAKTVIKSAASTLIRFPKNVRPRTVGGIMCAMVSLPRAGALDLDLLKIVPVSDAFPKEELSRLETHASGRFEMRKSCETPPGPWRVGMVRPRPPRASFFPLCVRARTGYVARTMQSESLRECCVAVRHGYTKGD